MATSLLLFWFVCGWSLPSVYNLCLLRDEIYKSICVFFLILRWAFNDLTVILFIRPKQIWGQSTGERKREPRSEDHGAGGRGPERGQRRPAVRTWRCWPGVKHWNVKFAAEFNLLISAFFLHLLYRQQLEDFQKERTEAESMTEEFQRQVCISTNDYSSRCLAIVVNIV